MTRPRDAKSIDWPRVLGPVADYGFDASELQSLEHATNTHSRRAVRLTPPKCPSELPFEVDRVPWYPHGYYLASSKIRPGGFLHYAAGDYYIQDAGSMLALAVSEIQPGQTVCDTCASPGGKSTGALERLGGAGVLISNEVIASRLQILNLALCRSGFSNFLLMNHDVEILSATLGDTFDCVIVDAPCTGQSMIVRGKQSLAAYTQKQIEHSSARQLRILRSAAALVKPGGRLVYSTCTFSFAENEHIVSQWLAEQPNWHTKRFPELAQWESPGFEGCYRLWPHRDDCAGGFACALMRPEAGNDYSFYSPSRPRTLGKWTPLENFPENFPDDAGPLDIVAQDDLRLFQRGQQIHVFPQACDSSWIELAAGGLPVAELQPGRTEPLYGAAVTTDACVSPKHCIELTDEEAIRFVAGESIRKVAATEPTDIQNTASDHPETQGWCVAVWRGRKLAWGKLAGGVLKNHFPKSLRTQNLRAN